MHVSSIIPLTYINCRIDIVQCESNGFPSISYDAMVSFCEEVVREIKNASSQVEIQEILMRAMSSYQTAHGPQHNSLLILNLIVSIRAACVETVDDDRISGQLSAAIAILREYQK